MAAEALEASMALAEQAPMVKSVSEFFFNAVPCCPCGIHLRWRQPAQSHDNPLGGAVSQRTYWDHPQESPAGKINMLCNQERKAGVSPIMDMGQISNIPEDCTARTIGNDTRSRVLGHRGSVSFVCGRSR